MIFTTKNGYNHFFLLKKIGRSTPKIQLTASLVRYLLREKVISSDIIGKRLCKNLAICKGVSRIFSNVCTLFSRFLYRLQVVFVLFKRSPFCKCTKWTLFVD